MKLYLTRHGQSEGNIAHLYQGPDESLTELGHKQAEFLANRFSTIPLDLLIVSPYKRAQQTANYIAKVKNLPILTNALLTEKNWGSAVTGKSRNDPSVQKTINFLLEKEQSDPEFKLADEERFIDLRERAIKFLEFVASLKGRHESICVVSHGHFLRVIIATILHGHQVSARLFRDLFARTSMHNAGITALDYSEKGWHIVTLNDHAHLGDYHRQRG